MKNGINSIVVFGDSILKGAVTGTDSGHLFDIIEDSSLPLAQKELGFEIENLSVFGAIITKGQKKLEKYLLSQKSADLAIIEFGGNDCDRDWISFSKNPNSDNPQRTPLALFMKTLDEMVCSCRAHKITPLLMTMPPLVGDWWFEHICEGNDKETILRFVENAPDALYRAHEIYSTHILKYALKNNVQFVDMRLALLESPNYRNLMCKDGIHPNEKGYAFMAEVWKKALPEVKKEF